MTNLVGIHQLLVAIPVWILAPLLYLATDGVIHFLRDKKEGFGYQTSWSAKYGDLCLLSVVLMVATNLHDGTYVPMWLHLLDLQALLFVACVVIGIGVCIATIHRRSGDLPAPQLGDIYHDSLVAPFLLFFTITLLPVVWYNANWLGECTWTLAMAAAWGELVYIDFKTGRINQRKYIAEKVKRGLTFLIV